MSNLTLDWTSTAIADLKAIWDYIALDNEAAADRTIDRIQGAARDFDAIPKSGTWKQDARFTRIRTWYTVLPGLRISRRVHTNPAGHPWRPGLAAKAPARLKG